MNDTPQILIDRILTDAAALKAQLVTAAAPVSPYPKALTDRTVRPKPAPLALGPAGSSFPDPTFGSTLWRVTDEKTLEDGRGCHTPTSIGGAWSADSKTFMALGAGGNAMFYDRETVTRLPVTIRNQAEPWFSYVDPHLIYANALHPVTGSYRLIKKWNIGGAIGLESIAVDLDTLYSKVNLPPGGYIGPLVAVDNDVLVVLFGGSSQDTHMLVHHSVLGLIDTRTLAFQTNAGLVSGVKLHGFGVDRLGRLILNPSNAELLARPGLKQAHLYNPITKELAPLTDAMKGGGHYQLGYGVMVNQDCCSTSNWDAAQWQFRSLNTLAATKDLISPILTPARDPNLISLSDHTSWRNARADQPMPVLSALFRRDLPQNPPVPPQPWRAWDDEIISIATDGSGQVWRHCHHQALVTPAYGTQPNVHVDPTGRFAIFSSNWGNTLGAGRDDVFLVALT